MLQWYNCLCVSIILLIASVSPDISTPHKAVEDLMGGKHKDVVRRERIATDREHGQTKLHLTNTVYTKHSGIGSFFKDVVLSPF